MAASCWCGVAPPARAQDYGWEPVQGRPRNVLTVGVGWNVGFAGARYSRLLAPTPMSVGLAVGAFGAGAQLDIPLPRFRLGIPWAARASVEETFLSAGVMRIAGQGAGYLFFEAGSRLWPVRRRGVYSEIGAGVASRAWGDRRERDPVPMVRLQAGYAF